MAARGKPRPPCASAEIGQPRGRAGVDGAAAVVFLFCSMGCGIVHHGSKSPAPAPAQPPGPNDRAIDGARAQRASVDGDRRRGRGVVSNASGRFEREMRVDVDDGWRSLEELPPFVTEVTEEKARRIITRNDSPDIAFDRSINPYRGCEHGCVYCFARPTHAYLGLSPGLDFESKLFAKPDAAALLRAS